MGWRHYVGASVNRLAHSTLSSRFMPLTRYVPLGWSWLYDIKRFSGSGSLQTIFDVGANVGQTAWGLVRYFPNTRIFCVEPVSSTMLELKSNYGNYHNINFVQLAFGKERSEGEMQLHRNSELNTLVRTQSRPDDLTGEVERVSIETIDQFCDDNSISRVDLIKMDLQGWELDALLGASGMLKRRAIRFIISEVAFRRVDSDMQYFSDLNEFMETMGFQFCGFYNVYRYGPAKEFIGFSDAMYVNPQFS
jgi:FkbM family methyltransferase